MLLMQSFDGMMYESCQLEDLNTSCMRVPLRSASLSHLLFARHRNRLFLKPIVLVSNAD